MSRLSLPLFAFLASAAGLWAQAPSRTTAIPDQTLDTGGTATTVDLKGHFGVTGFPNAPIALFETVLGNFYVELLTSAAPKHVENFKAYANHGWYDKSFFHRSSSLEAKDNLPDNDKDAKVLQGGGIRILADGLGESVRVNIPQNTAVELEYNQPNARGTLAAARGNSVNSATSQWFFNVADNTTALGQVNGAGGYSVFGRVIGNGMEVVDALAKLKRHRYSEAFLEFPLRNYASGPVLDEHLALIHRARVVETYPTAPTSPGLLRFEATSSDPNVVRTKVLGSVLELHPRTPGTATITVNAYDARNTVVSWSFATTVNAPRITASPASRTVAPGGSVSFSVTAEGSGALAYQWRKDGTALPGANGSTLTLNGVSAADAGSYTVAVSQGTGTTVSRPATLQVAAPVPGALANLSLRAVSSPSIIGFAVAGGSRQLLLRGIGPTLKSSFGVENAMVNPKIELVAKNAAGQDTIIAMNDNWGSNADTLQPIFAQVGAFPLESTTSLDAAVVASVDGTATAFLAPNASADGAGIAEIYDLAPAQGAGRLVNVSSRSWVSAGTDVIIAGFVISGNVPKRVLIRAIGPSLSAFNFYGGLEDTILEVHRAGSANELVARNDDWIDEPEVAGVSSGAFPLPAGSADSALVLTLPAGGYTATVRGHAAMNGVALVEIYDLD